MTRPVPQAEFNELMQATDGVVTALMGALTGTMLAVIEMSKLHADNPKIAEHIGAAIAKHAAIIPAAERRLAKMQVLVAAMRGTMVADSMPVLDVASAAVVPINRQQRRAAERAAASRGGASTAPVPPAS